MKKAIQWLGAYLRHVDKWLLFLCLLASAYGLVLIYSATYSYNTAQYMDTQLLAIYLGIGLFLVAAGFDIQKVSTLSPLIFFCNLLLLGSLYFWGVGEGGNRGWLRFGTSGFQPAELGKILFIITFARHLAYSRQKGMRIRDVLFLILHGGVVAAFVMLFSKDDGMTLAFICIAVFMAFASGIRLSWFVAGGMAIVSALPFLWTFLFDKYQKERILAVFDPGSYPNTAYQAMQTTNAIQSGGLWGKGYLQGSHTQYSLIPTKHTDSIFAVAGEELGFAGCALMILLLCLIILRLVATALRAKEDTNALIVFGIAGMLIFQTILNIGMNLGLLPVVGLTLPFYSYGGSSILTTFMAMGVAAGVRRSERANRQRNPYQNNKRKREKI